MNRDLGQFDKLEPTISPLRKYTGHASNVGVSLSDDITIVKLTGRMSIGTLLKRTPLHQWEMTGS